MKTAKQKIRYALGWIFVRPRRYVFARMIGSSELRLLPSRWWDGSIRWPNLHWWLLYRTLFKFCKWLYWDAWLIFCDWTGGIRQTYPLIARMIRKIGQTTAGFAISGGECFHCASDDGDPVDLSEDDTGETFNLEGRASQGTPDGTDHIFWGTTICPCCGYRGSYEDGSL